MLCFLIPFTIGFLLCVTLILFSPTTMLNLAAIPPQTFWFPVILYNNLQLIIAGHVKLTPSDNYNSFNAIVARLLNVPPDCIKSYLVNTNVPGATSPLQYQWRATVTPWTDFSLVCQQKDCCFLVFLTSPPVTQFGNDQDLTRASRYVNDVNECVAEEQRRKMLEMLQNQRNKSRIQEQEQEQQPCPPRLMTCSGVCEECNTTDQFHHCKLDAIVVGGGGRTSFGPIGPRVEIEPEIKVVPEIDVEPVNDEGGSYSLFGPMPGVDDVVDGLRAEAIAWRQNL